MRVSEISSKKSCILAEGGGLMDFTMVEAGWLSILPPVIAIVLALVTKEVYSSLFIGLISGTLIYSFLSGGSIITAFATAFSVKLHFLEFA